MHINSMHIKVMVPTAGVEPAQVAPLAPQTSASTNFATSARKHCHSLTVYFLTDYFGGSVGFGTAGAGAAGGAAGAAGGVAGAACCAAAAACAARSNTLVGSAVGRAPRYASVKLVAKNIAANTAVNFENKVLVPRAPNTVPDAPEPKPAPASAPLPRCMSTRAMMKNASKMCTPKINPRNIRNLSMANGRGRANLLKLISAQGSATYQSAIHVGHVEQLRGIAGLDAAAVEDPQMARHLSILRMNSIAQEQVHLLRVLRRGRTPGSDAPQGFVGEDGPRKPADP